MLHIDDLNYRAQQMGFVSFFCATPQAQALIVASELRLISEDE